MTMNDENARHAERCAQAIRNYGDKCDEQTNLVDFLTDARHWCDRHGESYAELDRRAYRHYLEELAEGRRGAP